MLVFHTGWSQGGHRVVTGWSQGQRPGPFHWVPPVIQLMMVAAAAALRPSDIGPTSKKYGTGDRGPRGFQWISWFNMLVYFFSWGSRTRTSTRETWPASSYWICACRRLETIKQLTNVDDTETNLSMVLGPCLYCKEVNVCSKSIYAVVLCWSSFMRTWKGENAVVNCLGKRALNMGSVLLVEYRCKLHPNLAWVPTVDSTGCQVFCCTLKPEDWRRQLVVSNIVKQCQTSITRLCFSSHLFTCPPFRLQSSEQHAHRALVGPCCASCQMLPGRPHWQSESGKINLWPWHSTDWWQVWWSEPPAWFRSAAQCHGLMQHKKYCCSRTVFAIYYTDYPLVN